jgi:hypothetical protein
VPEPSPLTLDHSPENRGQAQTAFPHGAELIKDQKLNASPWEDCLSP